MKGIIEMAQEEAKEEYNKYIEVVKERKEKQYDELKAVYRALSKGHKVIDIFDAFKRTGVNKEGEPKLAICRADSKTGYFRKENLGSGTFSKNKFDWNHKQGGDIILPSGTFENWEREIVEYTDGTKRPGQTKREKIETGIPIIPGHLLPNGKLDNYYILWEVKDWKEVIPPKGDPYLLKRISTNLFTVLSEWDVTDIERAVIRGHQNEE